MTLRTMLLVAFLGAALTQSAIRLHAGLTGARSALVLDMQRARTEEIGHALAARFEAFADGTGAWGVEVDPGLPDLPRSGYRDLAVPYDEAEARSLEGVALRAARRAPASGVALVDQDGETFAVIRTPHGVRVERFSALTFGVGMWVGVDSPILREPSAGALPFSTPAVVRSPRLLWVDSGRLSLPPPALPYSGIAMLVMAVALITLDLAAQIRARATDAARRSERQEVLQRLSHQLRTPAAAALSLAGTLRTASLDPAERAQLDELLLDEVRRLANGLDHLLRASRDDGGRAEADRVRVELVGWAREAQARWAVRAPGLVLQAGDPVVAEVDPAQLEEAVEALLDNARKHGAPPITLAIDARGGNAELTVVDAGPGVAPTERQRLVRKFERGAGGQGFGLGLWVAATVAEAHGGTLTIDGSRFTLALPLVRSP